jgi:ABC-type nitrate/sulfonate/bicarbonate transport system substrate-binding protein
MDPRFRGDDTECVEVTLNMIRKVGLALAALALMAAPAAAQQTELKVGISGTANTVLAIWMAEAAGFYAGQNLKVPVTTWAAAAAAPRRWRPGSST